MSDEKKSDPLADLQAAFDVIDADISPQDQRTIFVGVTGAGKSTIFNCLLHTLEYCYEGEDEYDKVTYRRADGQPFKSVIYAGYFSGTKFPASEGIYTDCPGFEDTNKEAQAILNAYSIDRLLRATTKIKIVLVSNWAELDAGRAAPFVGVLRRLGRIFSNDIDRVADSMCLITAKIESSKGAKVFSANENIARIRAKLKGLDNDLKDNANDSNAKKILKCLIDSTRNKVGFFATPPIEHHFCEVDLNEKKAVEQMLQSMDGVENVSPKLIIDVKGFQELQKFYSNSLSSTLHSVHEIYDTRHNIVKGMVIQFDELKQSASKLRKLFENLGKSLAIDDPEDIHSLFTCLQMFSNKSTTFLQEVQINQLKKYVNTFEFVRKLGIGVDEAANDMYNDCAKQILKVLHDLSKYFSVIGEKKLESIDNKLRLSGYIVGTSDLYESEHSNLDGKTEIDILSLHSLLIDREIVATGAHLTFLAPYWVKKTDLIIDLSGKDGDPEIGPHSDGEGLPGNPGLPGGHFYGHYKDVFGNGALEIISNGGNGSSGTRGIDGANGQNGVETPVEFVSERKADGIFNRTRIVTYRIARRGEKGGKGFGGGAKGLGGIKGTIMFKDCPTVKVTSQNGNNGQEGEPGEGGLEENTLILSKPMRIMMKLHLE